jgi:hypothetical protein
MQSTKTPQTSLRHDGQRLRGRQGSCRAGRQPVRDEGEGVRVGGWVPPHYGSYYLMAPEGPFPESISLTVDELQSLPFYNDSSRCDFTTRRFWSPSPRPCCPRGAAQSGRRAPQTDLLADSTVQPASLTQATMVTGGCPSARPSSPNVDPRKTVGREKVVANTSLSISG